MNSKKANTKPDSPSRLPTVLVIEDDRNMRELIVTVLKGSTLDFDVVALENGNV